MRSAVRASSFLFAVACAGCTVGGDTDPKPDRPVFDHDAGHTLCTPDEAVCDDDATLATCSGDGSERVLVPCAEHERCLGARCRDLCAEAAASHDYVGCEYWAVPLASPQLRAGFTFAVVVANPGPFDAHVTVEGGALDASLARDVAAGATEVFALPWISEVSQIGELEVGGRSVRVTDGAYRVRSDVPVLATQWSPLEYRLTHDACAEVGGTGCFSMTNDASLLLPVHALGTSHRAVSYATLAFALPPGATPEWSATAIGRGLFAVAAVEDGITEVAIAPTTALESPDGSARIEAGETRTWSLARGEVLELVAATPASEEECAPIGRRLQCSATSLDPTGTLVESDRPIAFFSGHSCAYAPFDRPACDHLEEQVLPTVALGRSYVVGRVYPHHEDPVPNLLRVISVTDGNAITFDPPLHPPVTLDAGQHVLFEQNEPVRIEGTEGLLVAQLTVGMEYDVEAPNSEGDPALVVLPPVEQWRTSYLFQVPGSYTSAYASVIAEAGAEVRLDGELLADPASSVGGYVIYDVRVPTEASAHALESSAPAGLLVHGYAPWTSYVHVGGLSVAPVLM